MNKLKIKSQLLKLLTKKKKNNFDLKETTNILFLRYDRIGDMVLTTPVFRELKKHYPHINISVLASKKNKDVILYNPFISEVFTNYKNNLLKDLFTLIKLRRKNFDVCVEFDHSVIIHAIIRLKIINPKKVISVYKDGRYGIKGNELEIYDFFTKKDTGSHFSKIWLDTLFFFDISSTSTKYDFYLGRLEKERAYEFISKVSGEIKIGINLDAFSVEKRLKFSDLNKICRSLYEDFKDIKIILLSSPALMNMQASIVSKLNLGFVISSYKTNSVIDAAALIKHLDLAISPDTSIVHIASAFNVPIISIHENNEKSYQLWAPKSNLSATVFAKSKVGLYDYNVDEVISSAKDFINTIKLAK